MAENTKTNPLAAPRQRGETYDEAAERVKREAGSNGAMPGKARSVRELEDEVQKRAAGGAVIDNSVFNR